MRQWVQQPPWGPTLCVTTQAFKRDVLRILTSDLDAQLRKHSLGIKVRSRVSARFVIITSAEIYWWTDLGGAP